MHKRVFALIVCTLLAIGCSQEEPEGKGASRTHIVATQDELDEGIRRIDQFKQELLKQDFREIHSLRSSETEKTTLKGRYGSLRDLEVTLWYGKKLESEEPHLGGHIYATIISKEADKEFDELYKRVETVVSGKAQ